MSSEQWNMNTAIEVSRVASSNELISGVTKWGHSKLITGFAALWSLGLLFIIIASATDHWVSHRSKFPELEDYHGLWEICIRRRTKKTVIGCFSTKFYPAYIQGSQRSFIWAGCTILLGTIAYVSLEKLMYCVSKKPSKYFKNSQLAVLATFISAFIILVGGILLFMSCITYYIEVNAKDETIFMKPNVKINDDSKNYPIQDSAELQDSVYLHELLVNITGKNPETDAGVFLNNRTRHIIKLLYKEHVIENPSFVLFDEESWKFRKDGLTLDFQLRPTTTEFQYSFYLAMCSAMSFILAGITLLCHNRLLYKENSITMYF